MTMNSVTGRIELGALATGTVRIIGLDAQEAVCAETRVNSGGAWQLDAPVTVSIVIVQATGTTIAAALAPDGSSTAVPLPTCVRCRLEFDSVPPGARVWIDPVSLDGFPDGLLPALRSRPDGTMELHLGDYPCNPGGVSLQLQPGRYRVAGGILEANLGNLSSTAFEVDRVEDITAGRMLPAHQFDVGSDDIVLRITFSPVRSEGATP